MMFPGARLALLSSVAFALPPPPPAASTYVMPPNTPPAAATMPAVAGDDVPWLMAASAMVDSQGTDTAAALALMNDGKEARFVAAAGSTRTVYLRLPATNAAQPRLIYHQFRSSPSGYGLTMRQSANNPADPTTASGWTPRAATPIYCRDGKATTPGNRKPQPYYIPGGPACWVAVDIAAPAAGDFEVGLLGAFDTNSRHRRIVWMGGNSVAGYITQLGEDVLNSFRLIAPSARPVIFIPTRGGQSLTELPGETGVQFAEHPRSTHLIVLATGNHADLGGIAEALPIAYPSGLQPYADALRQYYGQAEAAGMTVLTCTNEWKGPDLAAYYAGGGTPTRPNHEKLLRWAIAAERPNAGLSWDYELGIPAASLILAQGADMAGILGNRKSDNDTVHPSGHFRNPTMNFGPLLCSRFALDALISQILGVTKLSQMRELVKRYRDAPPGGTYLATQKADFRLQAEKTFGYWPTTDAAILGARSAVLADIDALPTGTASGTAPAEATIAPAAGPYTAGQAVAYTFTRPTAGTSHVYWLRWDTEELPGVDHPSGTSGSGSLAPASAETRYRLQLRDVATDAVLATTEQITVQAAPATGPAPTVTGTPGVPRGRAMVGEPMGPHQTNRYGTWSGATSYEYRFVQADGTRAAGVQNQGINNDVIVWAAADLGKVFYPEARGISAGGVAGPWTRGAALAAIVAQAPSAPVTVQAYVLGNGGQGGGTMAAPRVGDVLSRAEPIVAGRGTDGTAAYNTGSNAWRRNGSTTISGTTGGPYTVAAADVGATLGTTGAWRTVIDGTNNNLTITAEASTGAVVS